MKKFLFAILFIGIGFSLPAQVAEKPYNWALGIRASSSPSITAKHYFTPKSALDLDLGLVDMLKVGGSLAYEFNIKVFEKGWLYFGPMGQIAAFAMVDSDADKIPMTYGVGGVFGLEWVITKSFAVSIDTRHLYVYSEGSEMKDGVGIEISGAGFTKGFTYDNNIIAIGLKWHF